MLYIGASLMIGASIYGFVGLKQSHNKKEFTEMYTKEKKESPATREPVTIVEEKKTVVKDEPVVKKQNKAKKTVKTEKTNVVTPTTIENEGPGDVSIDKSNENNKTSTEPVVNKTKKKKRLNTKIFSRAALRDEEYVEEDSTSSRN